MTRDCLPRDLKSHRKQRNFIDPKKPTTITATAAIGGISGRKITVIGAAPECEIYIAKPHSRRAGDETASTVPWRGTARKI